MKTQGHKLITLLKHRRMTTMQLQMTGISTCRHKRVRESLGPDEKLKSTKNRDGLNVYWVVSDYTPKTVWQQIKKV